MKPRPKQSEESPISLKGYALVPKLLTAKEVAEILRIPLNAFYQDMKSGKIPLPMIRISERRARFRAADLEAFLQKDSQRLVYYP